MVKRLLVTGVHGFVGQALARMLDEPAWSSRFALLDTPAALDICDVASVSTWVAAAAPDAVIHLAAQSFVPDAFRNPAATLRVNVLGTLNLLQALRDASFRGRVVYVGTGDVYGRVPPDALPVAETYPALPRNPYAVSKFAAEALCRQWTITDGMDIVLARPFNHIGPGQSDRFVVSDFARRVAEIRAGARSPVVRTGDVDVTRDFTDVRDVVRAYFALLDNGMKGETYNVCSGCETAVRAILARLAAIAGVVVSVETDATRLRAAEQRRMCGDPAKIRAHTGWEATTPLDASLSGMLDHWGSEARR